MPIEFHDKYALITAVMTASKPVAFLVGSPLSTKDGIGVPGVPQMLELAREEIRKRASLRLPSFEDAIRGKSSGDAYQSAMIWLNGNLRQEGVNRVVQSAVMLARKAGTSANFSCDGNHCDWHIPAGTQQIAALICRARERFPGPILTTNFDPLLSLAIESCGGKPRLRFIQADGGLNQDAPRAGETEIVHLHGFWRDSDTLHTPRQLTAPRPRLKDSLKEILRDKMLIVTAYGGWDDVFARALSEVAEDNSMKLDVLWCFRDTNTAKIEQDYHNLFQRVEPAITRGRFGAYCSIDCHSIFGEIAAALPPAPASAVPAAMGGLSPIVGWQEISPAYLDALPPLTSDEIIRYFDGAVPTWRHAISTAIPRRQNVMKLAASFAKLANDKTARSMQLIRAAGGEGKSTQLLQAAANAARTDGWSVLWRTSPKEGISPEQIASLDPTRRWLIVADDADNMIPSLADSAFEISQTSRNGIHFLLAARDADWKNACGPEKPWDEWLAYLPDTVLRGISSEDAKSVLTAWAQAGPNGLRELGSISDPSQRIAAFESAVRDARDKQLQQSKQHRPQDGSFFGGLLAVRFGQNGLQAHVRAFLQRLKNMSIEHGKGSLFNALLYVAACHGTGIPGIDERVLADLVGVPREWVQSRVVRPLGEEAAAVHSAGNVFTRHSRVAAAILVEAEQTLGIDLADVWAQLVRQTVLTRRAIKIDKNWFLDVVHSGPRLQKDLPRQIPEDRRKAIAIAAAKADNQAQPERIGSLICLCQTQRLAGNFPFAVELFRRNVSTVNSLVDAHERIRGCWYEWGVCEGLAGDGAEHRAADAWLQGLSLSDHLNPAPITHHEEKVICAGLGVAFGKLAQCDSDCPYAKARRAVAYLGYLTNPDPKTASYFDRHDREANKFKTPHPRDVSVAIAWLTAGVAQAGRELKDPFLKALAQPEEVSFQYLRAKLSTASAPKHSRRHKKQGNPASQGRYKPLYPELEAAFDGIELSPDATSFPRPSK